MGKRQKYDYVSNTKRSLLIALTEQGMSIKEACAKININYSTGKTLMQQFRKTGTLQRQKEFIRVSSVKPIPLHQPKSPTNFTVL